MTYRIVLLGAAVSCALVACAPDSSQDVSAADGETNGSAPTAEPLSHHGGGGDPNRVFRVDYRLPVGEHRYLHVIEKFSAASLARHHRRGVFMLTGTLVNADQYDAVLDDGDTEFSVLERVASHGYIGAAASYEGYDDSSHPTNGADVTASRLLPEVGAAVELFRLLHGIDHVDLLGASLGANLAEELGGVASPIDRHHIGRIVVTSHVYKEVTPLFQQAFFSPEVQELFLTAPNGYVQTAPPFYALILLQAEADAAAWANATFPGTYATGPTLEGFHIPTFQASDGRAPLLQFWGDQDPITPRSDVDTFQAEYGGPSELAVLPGGGHAPYYEPVREQFWGRFFSFLDEEDRP